MALSAEAREKHLAFLVDFFGRDVWAITEWRDGCVFKTKRVGRVAATMSHPPLRPMKGVM